MSYLANKKLDFNSMITNESDKACETAVGFLYPAMTTSDHDMALIFTVHNLAWGSSELFSRLPREMYHVSTNVQNITFGPEKIHQRERQNGSSLEAGVKCLGQYLVHTEQVHNKLPV